MPAEAVFGTPAGGLLLDEWVEVVPNSKEIAGLTFQFGQPSARAPQAILVAVAPDTRPDRRPSTWDLDTLEAVVQETWELAWTRIVDPADCAPRTRRSRASCSTTPSTLRGRRSGG